MQELKSENQVRAVPLTKDVASAIRDISELFDEYILYVLTDTPLQADDADVLIERAMNELDIRLTRDPLVNATNWDDIDQIRWTIDAELQRNHGICAKNFFELLYTLKQSKSLIKTFDQFRNFPHTQEDRDIIASHVEGAAKLTPSCDFTATFTQQLNRLLVQIASAETIDQEYNDEIDDILLKAFYSYQKLSVPPPTSTVPPTPTMIGTVGNDIFASLPQGNIQRGKELMKTFGCNGCHGVEGERAGPGFSPSNSPDGRWISERAQDIWQQADYAGQATNAVEYLFESIVNPDIYLVPDFPAIQRKTYRAQMKPQDIADLIAYMLSLK